LSIAFRLLYSNKTTLHRRKQNRKDSIKLYQKLITLYLQDIYQTN
jgi:hypothetical protein